VSTPLAEFAQVSSARWAVQEFFKAKKGKVVLDHNQVRSWAGWCRHITLALLAHDYLAAIQSAMDHGMQKREAAR